MTQHDEAFPVGEAVRLAEKHGLLCRTFNAIDGVEACCPNCGHMLTDSLAALIADVSRNVEREVLRQAMEEAAEIAANTVCDTHIPTGIKIYGTKAGNAIRARMEEGI